MDRGLGGWVGEGGRGWGGEGWGGAEGGLGDLEEAALSVGGGEREHLQNTLLFLTYGRNGVATYGENGGLGFFYRAAEDDRHGVVEDRLSEHDREHLRLHTQSREDGEDCHGVRRRDEGASKKEFNSEIWGKGVCDIWEKYVSGWRNEIPKKSDVSHRSG